MGRIVVIAIAMLCAACTDPTLLRVTVEAGVDPPPTSLRITLFDQGGVPASRTFSPVTFPASLVVRGLPAESVCAQAEGLDGAGNVVVVGSASVTLAGGRTTAADIQMSAAGARCPLPAADLATGAPDDLGDGGGGGGDLAGSDLGTVPDMTAVQVCPPGSLFCDDFESGTLTKWSAVDVKNGDMGSVAPSMVHAAHGLYSVRAQGSGVSGADNYFEVEKDFPNGLSPPLAIRANLWTPVPLASYTMVMALYDSTTNGFSLGGDAQTTPKWVLTENQTLNGAPDHNSTTPTPGPGWHCAELVIDAAGMVTVYIDGSAIIGPFARLTAVAYTSFFFGIARTVVTGSDVFVDDVAIGPSRLYCPP